MSAHEIMAATAACNSVWLQASASVDAALAAAAAMRDVENELRRRLMAGGMDNEEALYRVNDLRHEAVPAIHHHDYCCLWAASRAVHLQWLCAVEMASEMSPIGRRPEWTASRRRGADSLRRALRDAGCERDDATKRVRRLVRHYRAEARRGWEDKQ